VIALGFRTEVRSVRIDSL